MNPVSGSATAVANNLLRGDIPERMSAIAAFERETFTRSQSADLTRVQQRAEMLLEAIRHESDERLLHKLGSMYFALVKENSRVLAPGTEVGNSIVAKTFDVLDLRSDSVVIPYYLLKAGSEIVKESSEEFNHSAKNAWRNQFKDRFSELATRLVAEQLLVIKRMSEAGLFASADGKVNETLQADFDRRYQIARVGLRGLSEAGDTGVAVCEALDGVLKYDLKKVQHLEIGRQADPLPRENLLQSIETLYRLIERGLDPEGRERFTKLLRAEREALVASKKGNQWQTGQMGVEYARQKWSQHADSLIEHIDDALLALSGAQWFAA